MAIKKIKELDNGTSGEYWVAQASNNMVSKQTDVLMLLFKDKASRDEGKTFLLRERVPSINGIYLTGEQVYAGVKASNLVEVEPAVIAVEAKEAVTEIQSVVVQEAKDAVLDEEGNVLEEAQPEIVEEQTVIIEPAIEAVEGKDAVFEESNWFADAEDIL
jgi:hypothetical protein